MDEPLVAYTEVAPKTSEVESVMGAVEERGRSWVRGELAALGPEAASAVAGMVDQEGLDPALRGTLFDTLEGWPLDRVVGSFAAYLDPEPSETVQRWLLGQLEDRGQGPVLGTYLAWISSAPSAPHLLHPSFHAQLSGTIRAIGLRHPSGFDSAESWLDEVSAGLMPTVSEALLATAGGRVCPALHRAFGRDARVDRALLAAVRTLDARLASRGVTELRSLASRGLASDDASCRTEAAHAMARFGDAEGLEQLVDGLESETDARARRAIERALHALTGLRFTGDLERTRASIQAERDWLRDSSPELLDQALGEHVALAIPALRTLGGHRLHREVLCEALLPGLLHADPVVAAAVARTLGDLDHPPAMVELLDHVDAADPMLRAAALQAMAKLSGQDLGATPQAWWDWFAGA